MHLYRFRGGWVFQERILSRRMLHFGPKELVWKRMTDELCESGNIKTAYVWIRKGCTKVVFDPTKQLSLEENCRRLF
jgi:hypothetical protein